MKFNKIIIDSNITDKVGLNKIDISRLGNIVALVGQNGAGKTRIIELVYNYLYNANNMEVFNHLTEIPPSLSNEYSLLVDKQIQELLGISANEFHSNIKSFSKYIKFINSDDIKKIKDNIVGDVKFEDILYGKVSKSVDFNEFSSLVTPDTLSFLRNKSTLILKEQFKLYIKNTKNIHIIQSSLDKNKDYILFGVFQKYIQMFLGKEFSFESEEQATDNLQSELTFDGKHFDIQKLSPGQKILFSYAVLFFYMEVSSDSDLSHSILIFDEPELHLHPIAQIKLINALKGLVGKSGQLWIATHSVHILSCLNYDEIYMVKDGKISTPNRLIPGSSLGELMGFDTELSHLHSFISSTSEWAYANFIVQCFKEPDVVFEVNINDPQYKLFKKVLSSKHLNVLDFGAGKGRVGYTLNEDDELRDYVVYNALEPNIEFHKILSEIPKIDHIYTNCNKIQSDVFDLVILCNVLHEINPELWVEVFSNIKRIIKPGGQLVIIEDKNLPKGENAHKYGYLILENRQFKKLFSNNNIIELESENINYKNRFSFCSISKDDINVSSDSILESLKDLNLELYIKIKHSKVNPKSDVSAGRDFANLTQQYINSKIALDNMQISNNSNVIINNLIKDRDLEIVMKSMKDLSIDIINRNKK